MNAEQLTFKIAQHKSHLAHRGIATNNLARGHVFDGNHKHSRSGNYAGVSHEKSETVLEIGAKTFPLMGSNQIK